MSTDHDTPPQPKEPVKKDPIEEIGFFSGESFVIGAVLVLGGAALYFQDLATFAFFMLCPFTAPVWVMGAFFAGTLARLLFVAIFTRRKKETPELWADRFSRAMKMADSATSRKAVLRDYLQRAIEKGMDRSTMVSLLTRNGWSESEIGRALAEISAT